MNHHSKDELYRLLNNNDKRNPFWDVAFKMYKDTYPLSDIQKECRSCRGTVLKWLRR